MTNDRCCAWGASGSLAMRAYHDTEWGVPTIDEKRLFEFLVLESAQAGLSWSTILGRREGYRKAFAGFDPETVASFGEADVNRLILDPGIIRNRMKIEAAITNARTLIDIREKTGSFVRWYWSFTDGWPIENAWTDESQVPPSTPFSDRVAKEFKARGFRFLGTTILYSFMQATGMVNDHVTRCSRYKPIRALGLSFGKNISSSIG